MDKFIKISDSFLIFWKIYIKFYYCNGITGKDIKVLKLSSILFFLFFFFCPEEKVLHKWKGKSKTEGPSGPRTVRGGGPPDCPIPTPCGRGQPEANEHLGVGRQRRRWAELS